jgi:hypothetical protein
MVESIWTSQTTYHPTMIHHMIIFADGS